MKYRKEKLKVCYQYSIDTDGKIYGKNGAPLKPSVNKKGYAIVNLMIAGQRKGYGVHTLVAKQFIGEPLSEKYQVNHKDGIKLNNCVDNLEWVTPQKNVQHAKEVLKHDFGVATKKEVIGVHKTTGAEVKFSSLTDAAKYIREKTELKTTRSAISSAINKGCCCGGYYWRHN